MDGEGERKAAKPEGGSRRASRGTRGALVVLGVLLAVDALSGVAQVGMEVIARTMGVEGTVTIAHCSGAREDVQCFGTFRGREEDVTIDEVEIYLSEAKQPGEQVEARVATNTASTAFAPGPSLRFFGFMFLTVSLGAIAVWSLRTSRAAF